MPNLPKGIHRKGHTTVQPRRVAFFRVCTCFHKIKFRQPLPEEHATFFAEMLQQLAGISEFQYILVVNPIEHIREVHCSRHVLAPLVERTTPDWTP